ncbi:MAG: RNA polymerase sigma factor SigI [Paenibacillaceae bacterium]|uniref:RNA polymerase sigma factor SigI n=1 Tax=Paenibacillus cymbidii TaxID=1639034 RepID=UPI001A9B6DB7|nr:RNA polymerase sigma factor SigI [Paenibacillus cymbidii]MBO9608912.1 RNA polymerase sigma factor SigI [Paenibacillaceae bacterium]
MLLVLIKRFLGKSLSRDNSAAATPESIVVRIQEGDLRLRNQFITDYQPFVAKAASRFCRRYVDPARDDEFSIALSAFNEAISQFSLNGGRSFLGFAETVIRRRLIDHLRKEQRFSGQVPYSSFDIPDEEDNIVNPVEIHQAIEHYEKQQGLQERMSEIVDLSRVLAEFDIQFAEMPEVSPKHADSRLLLLTIGKQLAQDAQLMRQLIAKRMLPIRELLDMVDVSRKTLERNRKYLIVVALIWHGPYPYLREYLHHADQTEGKGGAQ